MIGYGAMTIASFPPPFMRADRDMDEEALEFWGRTKAERLYLAPEKNVRADTPPVFLWQTGSEPGMYSMTLARALEEAGVPYELHIFPEGSHGLGLADGENNLEEKKNMMFAADNCCRADVLLAMETSLPLPVYAESMRRLCALIRERDIRETWPAHHSAPALRYAYKDIAIVCKA
ncbi:alpha/beta hydrolase [Lachnoclostridium sp. Marseille-P6806]|uniref:alpha/beta hydrolase n=1 Tax=Lachnoclostridium sp. Marseille-P6806 TaxID=2364793 RepID=UPI0010302DE0|nr:hypothetical protein [Lachnoclostridium sp. Marseille-P6806]